MEEEVEDDVFVSGDILYEDEPFHGVCIKAASKDNLISICLDYFDTESTENVDPFVDVFFLTYHWFMDSEELLCYFIDLFEETSTEDDDHTHCKIIRAVKFWLGNYGTDFERREGLLDLVDDLNSKIELSQFGDCSEKLNLDKWKELHVSNKTNYGTNVDTLAINSLIF